MAAILIVYSTTDGHTAQICERLKTSLQTQGDAVTVSSIENDAGLDFSCFDKIVVGASIRYGRHSKALYRFVETHRGALDAVPSAFFTVNAVARKPEKRSPDTNPYLIKLLSEITWKPTLLQVFAGKINYPKYGFLDRTMIRFIMWMTKGPTERDAVVDFTDWNEVEAFAARIAKM